MMFVCVSWSLFSSVLEARPEAADPSIFDIPGLPESIFLISDYPVHGSEELAKRRFSFGSGFGSPIAEYCLIRKQAFHRGNPCHKRFRFRTRRSRARFTG